MSDSGMEEEEAPDVICELENVQGLVDALIAVRWKRHQVIITPASPTPSFFTTHSLTTYLGRCLGVVGTRHRFDRRRRRLPPSQGLSQTRGANFFNSFHIMYWLLFFLLAI